ncbi:ribonuclease E [Microbispora rosea]|uniref:Ribonuclease E n=1 Tax=Microbispora rosea TaxID=58117 RepID=A0A1N7E2V8_9ACTN|nr:ribonuclease E [Microbispora rosea]
MRVEPARPGCPAAGTLMWRLSPGKRIRREFGPARDRASEAGFLAGRTGSGESSGKWGDVAVARRGGRTAAYRRRGGRRGGRRRSHGAVRSGRRGRHGERESVRILRPRPTRAEGGYGMRSQARACARFGHPRREEGEEAAVRAAGRPHDGRPGRTGRGHHHVRRAALAVGRRGRRRRRRRAAVRADECGGGRRAGPAGTRGSRTRVGRRRRAPRLGRCRMAFHDHAALAVRSGWPHRSVRPDRLVRRAGSHGPGRTRGGDRRAGAAGATRAGRAQGS